MFERENKKVYDEYKLLPFLFRFIIKEVNRGVKYRVEAIFTRSAC